MIRRTILAVLAAAVALAAPALSAQDEFHWTGKVAAGAAVEIKGVNGGIHERILASGPLGSLATKIIENSGIISTIITGPMKFWASLSIRPHEGYGGWVPSPR